MTPIFDPAVLDLLPPEAIVYVAAPPRRKNYQAPTKSFHLWQAACPNVSRPTEPVTLGEARERGLGLCGGCARTAQKRKRLRDAGA